jgi:rod shape-determining protein MreC
VYGLKKRHIAAIVLLALPVLLTVLPGPAAEALRLQTTRFFKAPLAAINNLSKKIQDTLSSKGFLFNYLNNKDLQIQALKAQNSQLKEIFLEKERLEDLLAFKQAIGFKTVWANVISRDPSNWRHSIIIDKGIKSGVRKGMFLISQQGLVGRVLEADRVASKAILLTDPNFRVAAVCQRSREQMIVVGGGRGLCSLKYLADTADVQVNDIIVTSGLGGFCPKGILIGEVASVRKSDNGLTLEALMAPSVRLSKVEEVLVLVE